MIELTNYDVQTVALDRAIIYDTVISKSGCGEYYKPGTGSVTLNHAGEYLVAFSANIAVPTGQTPDEISVVISEDGDPLIGTIMRTTPAEVEEFGNVSTQTLIKIPVCCGRVCCKKISVTNNSTIPITVDSPNLLIRQLK